MPSDRDLAQQWLAERLADRRGHGGVWHGDLLDAAAILDTPGVEVASEPAIAVEPGVQTAEGWTLQQIWGPWLVVRIPQPLFAQRSGVAAHQQDRTEEQR